MLPDRVHSRRVAYDLQRFGDGAIEAVFIEERHLVYEIFEAQFIKRLKS